MAVNTPARTATLTYDQQNTATRIIFPRQTLWITVPKGSILHNDKSALYHLTDDEYQAEIEISPFSQQHSFVHDPELEERIKEEGTLSLALYRLYRWLACQLFGFGLPLTQRFASLLS